MKTDIRLKRIFKKLDDYVDNLENNDFHYISLSILSCAIYGRISAIQSEEKKIQRYFNKNPEVYKYIKNYSIKNLIKLLQRIIRYENKEVSK